jgi:hypothetical protein
MEEGTGSSPLFENSAKDLVRTLQSYSDGEARALEAEARALVEVFRAWARKRPGAEERVRRISALFELHRRVMEFHTRRPPSTRPTP